MNRNLFDSMRKQMTPDPEVRAALSEKLARPAKKRTVPWKTYGVLAACAALVVGALGAFQYPSWDRILYNFRPAVDIQETRLHSYVVMEDPAGGAAEYSAEKGSVEDTGTGWTPNADWSKNHGGWVPSYDPAVQKGTGCEINQDMDMTPGDLEQAMLDVGYTPEEIDEYRSAGWQMTWAKWWKFVHEQENSEGDEPFNLDTLTDFSRQELSVNTGDLPDGAYVGDVPVQGEAQAIDKLLPHVRSNPDWYGGVYIDETGTLVVCLVESQDPGDKSLELQVLDWTDSGRVAFTDVKYSLAHLDGLMDQLNQLAETDLKCRDVMASWARDEMNNRVVVTLTQVNDYILSVLAELDPDDDAIYVQVGRRVSAEDHLDRAKEGEDPAVHYVLPGGTPAPDSEDLIADEPVYDGARYDLERLPEELPEQKQPAYAVDSAPGEDTSVSTAPCGPQG